MVARDTMWLSITWSSEVTSSISHLAHDPKSIDWFSNEDQSRLFFFCFFCFCLHQHIFFLLDLHPCIGIECEKFAHCVEISPYEYTCQCNTTSSTHTVKYTCNSQLTMSIIRMLLLFTKLLQLGLKALTQLSLQPVSLEQEELPCRQFCFGWLDCISRCSHRRNFWWRTVSHLVNWGYLSNSYYSQRKHQTFFTLVAFSTPLI